jgi:hypothetical protein
MAGFRNPNGVREGRIVSFWIKYGRHAASAFLDVRVNVLFVFRHLHPNLL